MADFGVRVEGADELESLLKGLLAKTESGVSDTLDELVVKGEKTAVGFQGYQDTGRTNATIKGYRHRGKKHNKAEIKAGGAAIWLEFGTGVAKNPTEHPMALKSDIPIYPHGGYGQGKGKHTNGWDYYDEHGKKHHTLGIAMNMFMYRTYEKLVDELPEMLRKNIAKRWK